MKEQKPRSAFFSFFSDLGDALFGSDADLFDSCAPFDCGPGMPSSGDSCHFNSDLSEVCRLDFCAASEKL